MTNTEMLEECIREKYKSIREFTVKFDIPYTTLYSIFQRGINNSSVANVNKICSALKIDIGDLITNEKITKVDEIEHLYKEGSQKNLDNIKKALIMTEGVLSYEFADKLDKKDIEKIICIFDNFFQNLNNGNY